MNLEEYNKVSSLNYKEYCKYLQDKHGIGKYNYMYPSWYKNQKASRTKEGLVNHHIFEDTAILLSNPIFAKKYPYEWQEAKNLVYCDYLEHLYLHILICEKEMLKEMPGIQGLGGIVSFIVPTLNDVYSGYKSSLQWQENCYNLIRNDLDVYLVLLKRFYQNCSENFFVKKSQLLKSGNEFYGVWSNDNNKELYEKIEKFIE